MSELPSLRRGEAMSTICDNFKIIFKREMKLLIFNASPIALCGVQADQA